MSRRPGRSAAGLLVAAMVVVACGDSSDDSSVLTQERADPDNGEPSVQAADVDRSAASPDAPVDELVLGLNDFAVDFSEVAAENDEENLVFSPTSIGVAFAMAHAGADEATAAEIGSVFGFPEGGSELHEAVNSLTLQLAEANTDDVVAELANASWVQEGEQVAPTFLETMAAYYGTGVPTVDFGDVAGSRDLVNAWVAERTRDRIEELVPEGMITPETRAMLVNAVYLKAPWQEEFLEGLTSDEPFTLADGSVVEAPTMRREMQDATFARGDVGGSGYVAVELPYEGSEIALQIVLPDDDTTLASLEDGLDGAALGTLAEGLAPAAVDLSLPRWDIETALDLEAPLGTLGVPLPGGDLSGILPELVPPLELGAAIHAATITVDEEGTEAAAATAVTGEAGAAPPEEDEVVTVEVDRPFLFVVRHVGTGAPLFYGRVVDPLEG